MEISIFGMKFRVEILILLVVLYWILWGHVLCSCSRVNLMESVQNMYNAKTNKAILNWELLKNPIPMIGIKEGFAGASQDRDAAPFSITSDKPINTSSWFTPNLSYKKGSTGGKGVQNILNRPKQQIPLPEGEMLMFANTEFKPECCPNAYSNSTGCACMTVDQYSYLISRSGNNVPYSEY